MAMAKSGWRLMREMLNEFSMFNFKCSSVRP
jgi:hypothetical protein